MGFQVVPGLDLAISFMNVGEISEIGIKTFLAYGSKGLEPRIPPYEALFYNVQLHEAAYDIAPENLTMYDRQTMW